MNINLKISVIVPAYNIDAYISRTIDSILNQTYKNTEIIAVDDGSTDNTGAILDDYQVRYPEKIRVIHKENSGVSGARLTGLQEASGAWIGFIDGDDTADEDMLSHLLKNALKYNADISHCGYKMIFEDGRINYFHNSKAVIIQNKKKGVVDLLEGTVVEPGLCNKLYKKELFENIPELLDQTIKYNEDLLMNFYLFSKAEKSVFEDICLYNYIVRGSSASRQVPNKKKISDPIDVKEIILSQAAEDIKPEALKALINTLISCYNSTLDTEFTEEIKIIRSKLKERKYGFKFLSKKRKLSAYLILNCPAIYKLIYKTYEKYFMENPYE
ncbi:MAG: glycosyltransferase [Clostridiales bacterium]|nr:glycosyltransferase [Clostridiales bacterium]